MQRLKDAFTGLLTFPDEHVGWIPDAIRRSLAIARARRVDCIYATGGPWSSMLAATLFHKLTRIPLVLDFRDPWSSNPNLDSHSRAARRAHARLESWCVRSAHRVITNTRELREDFVRRYSRIEPANFVCVTNGFEKLPRVVPRRAERFTLVHAGTLYLSRNPTNFLRALERLVAGGSIAAESVRVRFVGDVDLEDPQVAAAVRALDGIVEIIPRVRHAHAIEMQRDASVLLLFQKGFPLQVPRKLYEYLSLARPILAITEPDSATGRILEELEIGHVTDDGVDGIAVALLALYQSWQSPQGVAFDEGKLHAYSNEYLAERLRNEMQTGLQ